MKCPHFGEWLLERAIENNIWNREPIDGPAIPGKNDEPIMICGEEIHAPVDPEHEMFKYMSAGLDEVDRGMHLLASQIQSYNLAAHQWVAYNDQIGGLYSCYPDRDWWQIFPAEI